MKVYLVQHAESKSKDVDPNRSLTEGGRQDTVKVAVLAARMGLDVHQIRHSGKTRAEQTATILGEALSPPDGVVEVSGLAPLDEVEPVADELTKAAQPVMLVGHLPFMERLAGQMLTGDPESSVVQFRNAGIVCLMREERWQVAWIITPEIAAA
jgi:phosphohistidine phosphatase